MKARVSVAKAEQVNHLPKDNNFVEWSHHDAITSHDVENPDFGKQIGVLLEEACDKLSAITDLTHISLVITFEKEDHEL